MDKNIIGKSKDYYKKKAFLINFISQGKYSKNIEKKLSGEIRILERMFEKAAVKPDEVKTGKSE